MIKAPDVILIECYSSMLQYHDELRSVWWSKIPPEVHQLLMTANFSSMVLHWQEETIRELYGTHDSTFEEFTVNTKSLLADRLHPDKNDTVFIFGTRNMLTFVDRSICCPYVFPSRNFTSLFFSAQSFATADAYVINSQEKYPELFLQKVQVGLLRKLPLQPHPK